MWKLYDWELVFVLAMLAVLLIPGPTNALLATAAHSQGLSKTFWLIPMEWLGYAYGISFWAVFIHLADPVWPALLLILHITSVLYVFWMAFRLWKTTHLQQFSQNHRNIRPRQLFFSTLKILSLYFSPQVFSPLKHGIRLKIFSWFWLLLLWFLFQQQVSGCFSDVLYWQDQWKK